MPIPVATNYVPWYIQDFAPDSWYFGVTILTIQQSQAKPVEQVVGQYFEPHKGYKEVGELKSRVL